MKRGTLLAVAIVLIANAFTLFHAWRNRYGPADADITLTKRELYRPVLLKGDDDSEVVLTMQWIDPLSQGPFEFESPLIGEKTLAELGFDTSMAPSDKRAREFYQLQRARRAFLALEYDGMAWAKWMDGIEKRAKEYPNNAYSAKGQRESGSRLIAVDAARDAEPLRARYPDRGSVIVLPVMITIATLPGDLRTIQGQEARPAQLYGSIRDFPSSLHVPRPYSDRLKAGQPGADYKVHLRYGPALEPWIVGVEIPAAAKR